MAILSLTVTLAGGDPVTVDAQTRHQIAWERYARAHKLPAAPGPGFGATEYAAYLAYVAMRDAGHDVPDTFDAFTDLLDGLDSGDEQPPVPTGAAVG